MADWLDRLATVRSYYLVDRVPLINVYFSQVIDHPPARVISLCNTFFLSSQTPFESYSSGRSYLFTNSIEEIRGDPVAYSPSYSSSTSAPDSL